MESNKMEWKLLLTDASQPSRFAAEEFIRLMKQMDPESSCRIVAGTEEAEECLRIGVFSCGNESESGKEEIAICVKHGSGSIGGSEPGCVLIAVYRFFTECGCGFVRPGREGEYIPRRNSAELEVTVHETASYRHRGICIEGSTSYEHVVRMIDWAPKVGMNSYFTQFFSPYTFFDRWYRHDPNPYMVPAPVSKETVERFMADYTAELDKRGMKQHGVGHGWTAEALDLPGTGWQEDDDDSIPEEKKKMVALVGGKRKLWNKISLNTNLCYSSPMVKQAIVDKVVEYAATHSSMDYIHFWLADDANNHCECEECVKARPADFYVEILNAMDEALTAQGLPTRIVFLLYNELWWAPEHTQIAHPERFTLMFAPISRTYTEAMSKDAQGALQPYVRNQIKGPRSTGDALASLRSWQKLFQGDSFVFDYHYMWDHLKDPGYYRMAQVLKEDVENLHDIGLDGYISCQTQRSFLPNGLGMHMLGTTLWKGSVDFEKEAALFFAKTYGEDSDACRAYCSRLSELFDPPTLRGEKPISGKQEDYAAVIRLVQEFEPVIRKHLEDENLCHQRSWELLLFHGRICCMLAEMLTDVAGEQFDAAKAKWVKLRDFLRRNECKYHYEFDMPLFLAVWELQIAKDLWQQDWEEHKI